MDGQSTHEDASERIAKLEAQVSALQRAIAHIVNADVNMAAATLTYNASDATERAMASRIEALLLAERHNDAEELRKGLGQDG